MSTPEQAEALMYKALEEAKQKKGCVMLWIDGVDFHVWPQTDVPEFLKFWVENYGSSTITN